MITSKLSQLFDHSWSDPWGSLQSFEKFPVSFLEEDMFSTVKFIDLTNRNIGNLEINALCDYAKYLHTVNLSDNNIGDDGCKLLSSLPNLKVLDLSNNKISNSGFNCLLQHPTLTDLKLSHNYITLNKMEEALFRNSPLVSLDLSSNLVDHDGALNVVQMPNLIMLDLSNNRITNAEEILIALARHPFLKTLNFSNPYDIHVAGKVGARVVRFLSSTLGWTVGLIVRNGFNDSLDDLESNLEESMGKFSIEPKAACAIFNGNLETLDLSDTNVTTDIVSILVNSRSLKKLILRENNFGDEEAQKILDILPNNATLTEIILSNNYKCLPI